MIEKEVNAAEALIGITLKNDWKVIEKVKREESLSGGFFSVCYIVDNGKNKAFLKALNFQAFFQLFKGRPIVEIIHEQTNAFQYERELLLRCKNNKLSKVAMILDEGEEILDEFVIPNVPYLIFEIADDDIRSLLTFSKDIDTAWKLKSLHDVSVGIKQLHSIDIAHQDIKPSNVLVYQNGLASKIGDLGRSLCLDIEAPHENGGDFTGDLFYAPPEFLYRFIEPDWNLRVKATDLYLFGSLLVFYFTGTYMNTLLGKNIDPSFKWNNWKGSFYEVEDYLINGFYKALKEFKSNIGDKELAAELYQIVEYSCFPIPYRRGHPKTIFRSLNRDGDKKANSNQYDFERIVSKLDFLARKAVYKYK